MIEEFNINDITILVNTFNNLDKDKIISSINNNSFSKFYVYKINNIIVGYINFDLIYERMELIQINVKEEYQNNHIGSKLLEYMINYAKNNKVNSITLEVNINNSKAIYLYNKYNFKKISIRKAYYNGIDALLMEKRVD